jgi:hypothetical protein
MIENPPFDPGDLLLDPREDAGSNDEWMIPLMIQHGSRFLLQRIFRLPRCDWAAFVSGKPLGDAKHYRSGQRYNRIGLTSTGVAGAVVSSSALIVAGCRRLSGNTA